MKIARIESLFVGQARPLARDGQSPVPSGIVKSPVARRVRVSFTGLHGDEQGDPVYHGGAEKAVHHYPGEHYAAWRMRFPDSPVPLAPGAFGENISTIGMSEREVHIGDIYQAGSAVLQVSQGRQPCWKVNRHLNDDLAALAIGTLTLNWRTTFARRAQSLQLEDWTRRLYEP